MKDNETIMQFFEWYLPADCTLWHKVKENSAKLKEIGITAVWFPPAYKAAGGICDVGYGVYDLYDLGEFNQRGTVPTKYGTKDQYIEAINEMHNNGIKVLADIVFNQKMGADEIEEVIATEELQNDRNVDLNHNITIKAWTKFNFPERNNKYSDFKWNWTHFHGVDWDENNKKSGIYKFYGKHWDENVDNENGNYDYLMGADVDLNNLDVVNELINWTKWYMNFCKIDGFRLDAIKHIRVDFYKNWVDEIQKDSDKNMFIVGEYWKNNVNSLKEYLEEMEYKLSLFDVPLHYNLYEASNSNGNYDMSKILDNTLVKESPNNAVTFVNNHDTEVGQPLESTVQAWFRPLAYAIILLRNNGIPCLFYGDYYGINTEGEINLVDKLNPILKARKHYCYGEQHDYLDNENIIGWTLEGDLEHEKSGLAVIMSDSIGGTKNMYIGKKLAKSILYDITENVKENITVDGNGNANFICNGGSVSVWIKK